ncbi:MAG: DUF169 domain-containing protein [Actinomycetota bacterium]|nr:DUF169 domain-containing protein [Actinomycetota bacterium]
MPIDYQRAAGDLTSILHLTEPPIGITFSDEAPPGVPAFDDPMPEPTPDGRTGRVSAGCVFWMKAIDRTFVTAPEDHGNCSVGSLTHGLVGLEEAAGRADVHALVASGWVTEDVLSQIPTVSTRPGFITYGPLSEAAAEPDVVLLRVSPKQLMMISDALPDLHGGGKPQCHIVALAKEHGQVAASVGCMLSRTRTGMSPDEMTCALPAARLQEVLQKLGAAAEADAAVASYATEDSRRFT